MKKETAADTIPKIIHIIWIGAAKFPYKKNLKSWKRKNPEYEFRIWTDANIPKLQNQILYDKLPTFPLKADVLRLELLYKYGGIYTDIDSICMRPIGPAVKGLKLFGMTSLTGRVANGFLGTTAGHPAYKELIEMLSMHIEKLKEMEKQKISVFKIAGARYITPILRKYPEFTQLPRDFYCDQGEETETTYVIHSGDSYKKGYKKIKKARIQTWM